MSGVEATGQPILFLPPLSVASDPCASTVVNSVGCNVNNLFGDELRRGIANYRNSSWAILLLPAVLFVIYREVIGGEERYLQRTFS